MHLIHQLCHENDTAGLRALLGSRSDSDSVSELLSLRNDRGWTALHVAVIMNRVEVIKVLVSLGADFLASINAQGKYWIILYHILKLIIATLDSFGRTALDHAAYHGRFESLVLLNEIGAQTE